jgi:hypothetical protein
VERKVCTVLTLLSLYCCRFLAISYNMLLNIYIYIYIYSVCIFPALVSNPMDVWMQTCLLVADTMLNHACASNFWLYTSENNLVESSYLLC